MNRNVLIASSEFPPGPGGIGNHAYCLSKGLHDEGYTVSVISKARDPKEDSKFDKNLSFSVYRIPTYNIFKRTRLIIKNIHRHIKNETSIVIASGMAMLVICGFYSLFRRRMEVKFILVAHGIDINPTFYFTKLLVAFAIRGFHTVIPVSSYTAEKINGVKNDRLIVINNGFDPEKFIEDSLHDPIKRKGNPSLITVGSVTYRKGQINVIKALPILIQSFPGIHYHIIGLEIEKPQLMIVAKELGVENYITFHGALSNSLLKAHLEVADIFVMLSNHDPSGDFEGFGIAVLEANYMGLPAIGSEDSGLRDAIHSGYSGLLIDPKNTVGFKSAIEEILVHYSKYNTQAKEHATYFFWEKVIKKYITILNDN